MNTESSNDLVSISIDVLDRITGGNGRGGSASGGNDPSSDGRGTRRPGDRPDTAGKGLADAAGKAGRNPASTGPTVHNGGGNSDYYY